MTERDLCYQLTSYLRQHLPQAVILKHADRATQGVPDLTVTWAGRTVWVEVKYAHRTATDLPAGPALDGWLSSAVRVANRRSKAQLLLLARLAKAGQALYALFLGRGRYRRVLLASPVTVWGLQEGQVSLAVNPWPVAVPGVSLATRGAWLSEPGQPAFEAARDLIAWVLDPDWERP